MTRLSTQSPLSRGPDLPTGGRNISPGTFTPVANNSAAQILGLLSAAAGTISTVQNVSNRRTAEQEAEEWQITNANLIRLREESTRDRSKEASFLAAYTAAEERFAGTRFAPELVNLGERQKTFFQGREEERVALATENFYYTNVAPNFLAAAVPGEPKFEQFVSINDAGERYSAVLDHMRSSIPANMPQYMGPDGQERLDRLLSRDALRIASAAQAEAEKRRDVETLRQMQAGESALIKSTAESVIAGQGVDQIDQAAAVFGSDPTRFTKEVAEEIASRFDLAMLQGDSGQTAKYADAMMSLFEQSSPDVRAMIVRRSQAMVDTQMDTFIRMADNNMRQALTEDMTIEGQARAKVDYLMSLTLAYNNTFGTNYTSLNEVETGNNPVKVAFLSRLLRASEQFVSQQQTMGETSKKILNNYLNPAAATPQSLGALMSADTEDAIPAMVAFAQALGDGDLMQKAEAAAVDFSQRGAWAVAALYSSSNGIGADKVVSQMFSNDSMFQPTNTGNLAFQSAVRGMGEYMNRMGSAAPLSVISDAKTRYAFRKTMEQANGDIEDAVKLHGFFLDNYNAISSTVGVGRDGEGNRKNVLGTIGDAKFAKRLGKELGFKSDSLILSDELKTWVTTFLPDEALNPDISSDPEKLATVVVDSMQKQGFTMFVNANGAVSGTTSRKIPEAHNMNSDFIQQSLNLPGTRLSRLIANTIYDPPDDIEQLLAPEEIATLSPMEQQRLASERRPYKVYTSIWDRLNQELFDGDVVMTPNSAQIRVLPEAADTRGTPIVAVYEGRIIPLGFYDFEKYAPFLSTLDERSYGPIDRGDTRPWWMPSMTSGALLNKAGRSVDKRQASRLINEYVDQINRPAAEYAAPVRPTEPLRPLPP